MHVKVHVLSFNFICLGEILGDQVKGRSPNKLKMLLEVLYVLHVKVHVVSFSMIMISSA